MPYMVEVSDESKVQLRVMCLDVAQRMMQIGVFCAHEYLDEARKMFDFIVSGVAPLPPEDHDHASPDFDFDLADLVNTKTGDGWTVHYVGGNTGETKVSDGETEEWFGDDVGHWISGAPMPPDEEEE